MSDPGRKPVAETYRNGGLDRKGCARRGPWARWCPATPDNKDREHPDPHNTDADRPVGAPGLKTWEKAGPCGWVGACGDERGDARPGVTALGRRPA